MVGASLRLERLVGRGAMGTVWTAEHLGLRSTVAVKFMAQAMMDDPVSLMRFQQEAKAAAEIRSPHVVRVFDHGATEEGVPYIVMELLDGESLDRRMKRLGRLPLPEVATIVRQSARALAKAHERGIVHRDIKPGNIFVSSDDELFVKVVDFGVAKFSGQEAIEMTAQGNMVGTPAYMSPEQLFHGRALDHRGDLWSLAVVAYQATTGDRPFDGLTLGELCISIKRGEYVAPSRLRSDLPAAVDVWFARAFASDVEARFASARELAQAFDEALGNPVLLSSTPSLDVPRPSAPNRLSVSASEPGSNPSQPSAPQVTTFSGGTADSPGDDGALRRRTRAIAAGALVTIALVGAALATLLGGRSNASSPAEPAASSVANADARPSMAETPLDAVSSAALSAKPLEPSPEPVAEQVPRVEPSASARPASAPSSRPASRGPASNGGPSPAAPSDDLDERSKRAGEQLGI